MFLLLFLKCNEIISVKDVFFFVFLNKYIQYNLPHHNCVVLQALDFLQQNSRNLHFGRTKLLPVSGAFHTELMASATEPLREVLRQVEVSKTHMALLNMHTPNQHA